MARELSQSTGSLPSSTSDSMSTKSDQSRSVSSLSMNGGEHQPSCHGHSKYLSIISYPNLLTVGEKRSGGEIRYQFSLRKIAGL